MCRQTRLIHSASSARDQRKFYPVLPPARVIILLLLVTLIACKGEAGSATISPAVSADELATQTAAPAVATQSAGQTAIAAAATSTANATRQRAIATQVQATATAQSLILSNWKAYTEAVQQQDWERVLSALDVLIGTIGPTPRAADYPSPPYDPRLPQIANLQALARLQYAGQLQRTGKLEAAHVQYEAVQTAEGVQPDLKQQAAVAAGWLKEAENLWVQVNQSWDNKDWGGTVIALEALRDLEGFGSQAQDTESDNTVGRLIELAIARRDAPPPIQSQTVVSNSGGNTGGGTTGNSGGSTGSGATGNSGGSTGGSTGGGSTGGAGGGSQLDGLP